MNNIVTFLTASLLYSCISGQVADDILGTYQHVDKKYDLTIEIAIFKRSDESYGCRIVQIYNHNKEQQELPYKAKHNRPLLGSDLMEPGLRFSPEKREWTGKIYHPVWKRTLSCVVTFPNKNHLRIYAYMGPKWLGLGDSLGWNRVKK